MQEKSVKRLLCALVLASLLPGASAANEVLPDIPMVAFTHGDRERYCGVTAPHLAVTQASGYVERYQPKNLRVLKETRSYAEMEDWFCPQAEGLWGREYVKDAAPTDKNCGANLKHLIRFAGELVFLDGLQKICSKWKKPSATHGNTNSSLAVTGGSKDDPLKFPPKMSGLLRECLQQVTGDRGRAKAKDTAWQSEFDSDWNSGTRGGGAHQNAMLAQGNLWVEGRGWVEGKTIQGEQLSCVADHLKEQIVRLASSLAPDQQLMISNIARQIMAEGDPAVRMAQLQRLRQGTFLTITADADRAYADAMLTADQMQTQEQMATTAIDLFTTLAPPFNDVRMFYEMSTGRDTFTGRELSWWERALNAGGLLLGYGSRLKELTTAARPMEEALQAGKLSAQEAKVVDEALKTGKGIEEAKSLVPFFEARDAAAKGIRQEAAGKVEAYLAAVKSRDAGRIRVAVVELKGDRQAITLLNNEGNFVKKKFNDEIRKVYDEVDEVVKKEMAEHYNRKIALAGKERRFVPNQGHGLPGTSVSAEAVRAGEGIRPEDVSIFSASNPSTSVKVGRDRDYTIRIFGQDVPSKEARQIYEQAMFDTMQSKGMLPRGVKTPRQLGEKLDQAAVHWLDAEAYNRQGLAVVLNPAQKGVPLTERRLMGDVQQIGATMEFKGVENFAKADQYRKLGQLGKAEESMMEGMYQTRKQFDNQLVGRVEAAREQGLIDFSKVKMSPELRDAVSQARQAGNEGLAKRLELQAVLPEKLRKQVDILRKVEEGWSPAKAEALLKQVFQKTPDDIARELKEAMTEWEKRIMSKRRVS